MADDPTADLPYITYQEAPDDDPAGEVQVQAPIGLGAETAQALLKAAADQGLDAAVVKTADGHFLVPAEVADAAELPEGAQQVENLDASVNATGPVHSDEAPAFATKAEAKAFADEHGLDVPDDKSDAYRAAVATAYQNSRPDVAGTTSTAH